MPAPVGPVSDNLDLTGVGSKGSSQALEKRSLGESVAHRQGNVLQPDPQAGVVLDTVVGYSAENGVYGFEQSLVYSAGNTVVVLNLDSGKQQFWQLEEKVTALGFVEASFTESP